MEKEIEFLEYIYNLIKIEKATISRIIKLRNKTDELSHILRRQIERYNRFLVAIKNMLERRKKKSKDLNILEKMASYAGAKSVLSKDNSLKDVLNILTKRYQISAEDVKQKREELKISSKTILNLSDRLMEFQKNSIEDIRKIHC